jgi:hypothetical protein
MRPTEVVEIRAVELALGVVEHPHDPDAEDGHAPTQLVLADGVEVPPVHLAELEVAVLPTRCGRLVGEPRVEPATGDAHDDDVRALRRGARNRASESKGLVAGWATITIRLRAGARSRTGRQMEDTAGSIRA